MDPKLRLKKFVNFKGISNNQFTQKVGLANGYLTGVGQVSSENLAKINEFYPELNLDWVIMGKGHMIRPEKEEASYEYPVLQEDNFTDKLKEYCNEYPELELIVKLLSKNLESNENTIRALTITLDTKDKIIDNLLKENHELREELAELRSNK